MRSRKIPSKTLFGALILCAAAILCIFRNEFLLPSAEGKCEVHFIDVGQGDAEFLRTESGCILIDAGTTDSRHDLVAYLEKYTEKIDYMILTHPHEDHMGGAADILESVTVDCLVMSDLVADEEFYTDAIKAAKKQGTEIIYLTSGAKYNTGNISIEVFDLFEFYSDDYNNSSLFIKIEADGTTLLVTGDSEAEEEEYALEKYGGELDCDILKVGHHGSRTSSSEEFLEAVTPNDAVISCGRNNSYGHPTSEVLDRLNEDGIIVYRTDLEGNVVLRGEKAA